jgi:GNAT superfamily N-acetyltransferase
VQDVNIRLAKPSEADAVAEVLSAAFAEFEDNYTAEALAYVTPKADEVRGRFAEGPIWIAAMGDELVGTVSVVPEPEWLYIRSMAVLPAAQGRGVGGRLLAAVENYADEIGMETLFLYTTPFSNDAIRLYEKNGFIKGRETTADEWCGTPGLEMWKYLERNAKTNAVRS